MRNAKPIFETNAKKGPKLRGINARLLRPNTLPNRFLFEAQMKAISWIARVVAAVVLLHTLFFKFTGAPESVYIFSQLGVEPWGRFVAGISELIAAILLLVPRTAWMGAGMGLGVMSGALLSHVFVLGIDVQGDGGLLFGLGVVVFLACAVTLFIHKKDIPFLFSGNK